MRIVREQKYAANLQLIPDYQLQSMKEEYNFTNPYKRLQIVANKITDYCENYADKNICLYTV